MDDLDSDCLSIIMFCMGLQACVVQPKVEMDLEFELTKLSTPVGYVSAIALCVATFGTIAFTSGFFLKPDATFDDYVANVVPLFGGFITVIGVSEVSFIICNARSTELRCCR